MYSNYEINGTYQLSKMKATDRVSGSLLLHAYLHLPDPSYIESLKSLPAPVTPPLINIKKLFPLKNNGWMGPGSGIMSAPGEGKDHGFGNPSELGIEMESTVTIQRNSSPSQISSRMTSLSSFPNLPSNHVPSSSETRVGDNVNKLRDRKENNWDTDTGPDSKSEDSEPDSDRNGSDWNDDENQNVLDHSFAKGSPKLTESPDRKLFRVRPAVSTFLLNGNHRHGMHVKSKTVRTLQSASSIESSSLSGSVPSSSLCDGQNDFEEGGSTRFGSIFKNENENEDENENFGRNWGSNNNEKEKLLSRKNGEKKVIDIEEERERIEEREDLMEESFSSYTTSDIIPNKNSHNNVRIIIDSINNNLHNKNGNNNNKITKIYNNDNMKNMNKSSNDIINNNDNNNRLQIQRNKLLIRPNSSNGLLNVNRQSMLDGVSKCLYGLSLVQDETNEMLFKMQKKLEIRQSARAAKCESSAAASNINYLSSRGKVKDDKKIDNHEIEKKEILKKRFIDVKKCERNQNENENENENSHFNINQESHRSTTVSVSLSEQIDPKSNFQKLKTGENNLITKNISTLSCTSLECSAVALNPFRNILENTEQSNDDRFVTGHMVIAEIAEDDGSVEENIIENYDSFSMESDPGSLSSGEMIVISSSDYTVTTSHTGVATISSPIHKMINTGGESSSRSPMMESSTRSPVMESSSRSPMMESSSRSPMMESSSRSPMMESSSPVIESSFMFAEIDSPSVSIRAVSPFHQLLAMTDNHVLSSKNVNKNQNIIHSIDNKIVPNENRICNDSNKFITSTDTTSASHNSSFS